MKKKVLIIDNNIDQNDYGHWPLGTPFRRYLDGVEVTVRRGPQGDLPSIKNSFTHILISGSKTSCLSNDDWVRFQLDFLKSNVDEGKTILGVCFGHQLLARIFGGESHLRKSPTPEMGWVEIEMISRSKIFENIPEKFHTFQSHGEEVFTLSQDLKLLARSKTCENQAFEHKKLPVYGVQFHPESNAEEGERSISKKLKDKNTPKDCIFNAGRANSLYSESIAQNIFKNFIKIG